MGSLVTRTSFSSKSRSTSKPGRLAGVYMTPMSIVPSINLSMSASDRPSCVRMAISGDFVRMEATQSNKNPSQRLYCPPIVSAARYPSGRATSSLACSQNPNHGERVLLELTACNGQRCTGLVALEQRLAELSLERADAHAHGRLRNVDPFGSFDEAAGFDDGEEGAG